MQIIQSIEECSFRALPALQTRYYDGWVLRFANGYTRRANSVNPLYTSSLDITLKVDYCRQLYQAQDLPLHFKLTDAAHPPDLDDLLAERGFEKTAPTQVQVCKITDIIKPDDVIITETLNEAWLNDYWRLNTVPEHYHQIMQRMLQFIDVKIGCAAIYYKGQAVAVGLGVCDGEYIGLFDIVTDDAYRRRGFGQQIVSSLLHWGKTNGAETAYLQVMTDNEAAILLYSKLDFTNIYNYWYRTKV